MDEIEQKRQKEQRVVEQMIAIYCHGNHGTKRGELCSECTELVDYAKSRSDHCSFIESKTFCNNCRVHCYKPDMRERIRVVMRYSGPRMIFHHPGMALWHVVSSRRESRRLKREANE